VGFGSFGLWSFEGKGHMTPVDILGRHEKRFESEELQLALAELYETMFGICDHRDPLVRKTRPLALMAAHPKENTSVYSPLYRRIDEFLRLKLGDSTNLSLTEFMAMPADWVRYIIQRAQHDAVREGKEADKVAQALRSVETK
jgi:hypothetical protein